MNGSNECIKENIDDIPLITALKGYVDKILAFEEELEPGIKYNPNDYPTKELITDMWKLLVKASNRAIYHTEADSECRHVFGGLALPPNQAFLCVSDYIRTARFIAGACAAIKEAQKRFPGEKIRIVDAGCGPFALLSVAAMTQFSPAEVEFTLIDIFKSSLTCVRAILKTLGLESYANHVMDYDAATIKLPQKAHVVLAEVIDRGLTSETQVPITMNLGQQLMEGGIFVPEAVQVNACLSLEDGETVLGEVAQLTRETSLATLGASHIDRIHGIKTTHRFPLPPNTKDGSIHLSTHIQIFNGHTLKPGESSITQALPVGHFKWDGDKSNNLVLHTTFGGEEALEQLEGYIN